MKMSLFKKEIIVKKNNGKTEIEFCMNSENDSYDKPSRKVTRILVKWILSVEKTKPL